MKLSFNKLIFPLAALVLFFIIFNMIDYLAAEKYIIECFTTNENISENISNKTSHTVDLPLTTRYSCKNFCGPTSRCSITGQQCFTDIDCPGCQPYSPPLPKTADCIPSANDAGKLTVGVSPNYSPLTSGYGTTEKIVTDDIYEQPSQPNFGVDTWGKSFNDDQTLFNRRYKSDQLPLMPNYPSMYSLTGEFISDGPLPSNY
jgi:hypothetical protein